MKALLINPTDIDCVDASYDLPYQLLSLASYARSEGFQVDILDLALDPFAGIPYGYDVYGITSVTPVWEEAVSLLKRIRKMGENLYIIVGGKHVSAIPEDGLKAGFDSVFVGEAEIEFVKFLRDPRKGLIKCGIVDLFQLPAVDYLILNLANYAHRAFGRMKTNVVMASRGCEFSCAFCYNLGRVRLKSSAAVKSEIEQVGKDYSIFFCDDNFLSKSIYKQYLPVLKNYTWGCMGRAEALANFEEASCLKENGLTWVHFGLESGSPNQLRNMSRTLNLNYFRQACINCNKLGISVKISIIVGFPGETWDTIFETERFLKGIPYDLLSVFPFIPFPGTPVYNNPSKFGVKRISSSWKNFRPGNFEGKPSFVYDTDDLKSEDISKMWNYMSEKFSNSHVQLVKS